MKSLFVAVAAAAALAFWSNNGRSEVHSSSAGAHPISAVHSVYN